MDLVFVLLGLFIVATPLLAVFVFVRQQRFDRQLRQLVESSAQQNDALHRELLQLKRQVDGLPKAAASNAAATPSPRTKDSAPLHIPSTVPGEMAKPVVPAATLAEPTSHPAPVKPAGIQPAVIDKRTQPALCAWCGTVHAGGVSQCPKPAAPAAKGHPPEVGLAEKPPTGGIQIEKQLADERPSAAKHDQMPVSASISESALSTPVVPPHSPRPAAPGPRVEQHTATAPPRVEPHVPAPIGVTPPPAAARVVEPPQFAPLRSSTPRPTAQQRMKSVFALEETLGTNWLNKLGIIILVLGVALFGIYELGQLGPAGKVGLSYVVSVAFLAGGILLEKRERYRVLGHTLIGGGWALLFFTTYALNHVQAMRVLSSETMDLVLMLAAALGMAAHTLRYRSQLVTGLSFLLAYGTVSLSHDNVYSLASGVILALGLVSIVIKMDWFELEAFGILSSYLNHLYWLYKLLGADGAQGRAFPEYHASTALLLFYWLIYRFSYLVRKTKSPLQEHVSTAAALLNTLLLMGVMKFQSVHPELAFVALLAIGAVEFTCGQFPITKRRREAFIVLSVLGAALMIAAVPFRYSGNNVAILWQIGGEALLVAGVAVNEKVFRRLGLLTGVLVGMHLVGIDFAKLMDFRNSSEELVLTAGAMFSLCAVVFYLNTLVVGRRWEQAFKEMIEAELISVHSYIGAFAAGCAAWALCAHDWTALAFAGIMLTLAALASKLKVKSGHLQVQYGALAVLTLYRVVVVNLHTELQQYTHVRMRLLTLPLIAAAFYVTAKLAALRDDSNQRLLRGVFAFAGTTLVIALGYYEVPELWQPLAAISFAVVLVEVGQRIGYPVLVWHAHLLTALAVAAAVTSDPSGVQRWHNIPLHAFGALPVIAGAYWIARRIDLENTSHVEFGRIAYSWVAAGVMVWVLNEAVPLAWIAVSWIAFAVALAVCLRWIRFKHLAWQANVVAALTLIRVYTYNFTLAQPHWHGVSVRLVTVTLVAAGLYFLSRKATFAESNSGRPIAYLHTFAATGLLALLAWYEAPGGWLAAVWAIFALVLALVDLRFELDDLRWQAHALAAMAVARSVMVNLYLTDTWHGISVRLLSVAIVALVLYVLSRIIRMPAKWRDREFHHIYSWVASALVAMLLWYELTPMSIAVGWGVFGLVLFEYGLFRKIRQFRFQAYTALAAAFGRIFFANLTAGVPGELLGTRLYTVLPLSLIFFFVYAQLQPTEQTVKDDRRLYFDVLLGYIGTGSIVAFLYFQYPNDWLVTAWALVVFALLGIALLLKQSLFLYQGLLLTVGACLRGILHNLFGASYFSGRDWTGRYVVLGSAVPVLLACLPFAFRLRERYKSQPLLLGRLGVVARRPEQLMFFGPVVLLTLMLALKMRAGMVTVAWGIEGVLIVLLALAVGERSYRLTGMVLLLACVAKVLVRDAWGLAPRDRYITFIILGAALLLVSFLYTKYREAIRQFL